MIGSEDPEYTVSAEEVMNAQVEMFMYANELAAKRRGEPADDIVTALLEAEVDGDTLTEMDFNLFFLLLAVAGNETTRNSISHGIRAFCDYPEQYQLLVDDPRRRRSRPRRSSVGRRRSCTSGATSPRTRRSAGRRQGRRQGQHLVHLGEPRRGRLRRSVHLRHHA